MAEPLAGVEGAGLAVRASDSGRGRAGVSWVKRAVGLSVRRRWPWLSGLKGDVRLQEARAQEC